MSPGGLTALLLHHRTRRPQIKVGDAYLIEGRRECQALGLLDKDSLTAKGRAHIAELCGLPIHSPEVKL